MGELAKLPNIGKVLEEQLNQAGITTYEELKEIGSRQAWLKIKAMDDTACLHRHCIQLEGAILGIKKASSPQGEQKQDLKVSSLFK